MSGHTLCGCADTDDLQNISYQRGQTYCRMADGDKIQFRGAAEKEATEVVDQLRLGGINVSELARQGLRDKLREALSDEEKITLHQQYKQGDLPAEVAEILLGDALEDIEREQEAFEAATELDTTGVYQE